MDRISGLPDAILHDILSKMSYKDAVRTNVLSKAWRKTWITFPILYFHENRFNLGHNKVDGDFLRKRKIFIDYVMKTLLRFRDQGLAIKEFTLNLINYDRHNMSGNIDLWLKLAVDSGVEVLRLGLDGGSAKNVDQWYTFPPGVLEAKSLIKLELTWGVKLDQIVLNHSIQDFSLRVLCLESALLGDEGIIGRLISRCPLIEQLKLKPYVYDPQVYEPYVYAPPFRRLRVLRTLESLKLNNCCVSERINISSAQLKVLELSYCPNLKVVNIDAPNLLSCVCRDLGGKLPVISFLRSSSKLEVTSSLHFRDLYNLREIMQNFKTHKVLALIALVIYGSHEIEPNLDVLQDSSHLPIVKHLHLSLAVPRDEDLYLPLVNHLLSSCCPETISFSLHPHSCCEAFAEFLREMLMGRNRDKCYCSSGHTKCWWHDLKIVNITRSVETISFRLEL